MTEEANRKEALRLAGILADAAIRVSGGNGLNGRVAPANLLGCSALIAQLQKAVDAYNDHIVAWSTKP